MWTPCPRVLDEPVKILGLELVDIGLLMMLPLLLRLVLSSASMCFGIAGGVAWILTLAKRGRPYGALPHLLHALELLPWPGVLRPAPVAYTPWHSSPWVVSRPWQRLVGTLVNTQ